MKKTLSKQVKKNETSINAYSNWPCNCSCSCSCGSIHVPDATVRSQINSSNFAKNVNH
jgi:hypothetical protein